MDIHSADYLPRPTYSFAHKIGAQLRRAVIQLHCSCSSLHTRSISRMYKRVPPAVLRGTIVRWRAMAGSTLGPANRASLTLEESPESWPLVSVTASSVFTGHEDLEFLSKLNLYTWKFNLCWV